MTRKVVHSQDKTAASEPVGDTVEHMPIPENTRPDEGMHKIVLVCRWYDIAQCMDLAKCRFMHHLSVA